MLYSSLPEYMVVPPEGTVGTEAFADIDITLNDGRSVPRGHHIPHLERKAGRAPGAAGLVLANTDDLAIGQLIALLQGGEG